MRAYAAVIDEKSGRFRFQDLQLDEPRPTEVLVRVVACGICQTDLHVRDQDYPVPLPLVLGHEGAGVVEAVGSGVGSVKPGDHVVISYPSCQNCRYCRSGRNAYCEHSFELCFGAARLDGSQGVHGSDDAKPVHGHFFAQSSFSTYALADVSNLVRVPNDLPLERLAPLGCGFQTGAGAVLKALKVEAGASLAIIGTGSVGLAAVMAARIASAGVIAAVDITAGRLALARDLGATHVINAREEDLEERLREIAPQGFDYVLEVTAKPEILVLAVRVLAPLGVAALVGGAPKGVAAPIELDTLLNGGRTVRGIVQGDAVPQLFIPEMIEHHRAGRFPFDRMLSFYDFKDIETAIADMQAGQVIKPVLRIGVER